MKKLLLVALAVASLGIYGCSGDSTNFAATPQRDTNLRPTGSIQGVLTDSVTNQPIVGAVVDIGVGSATTNANGVYVISNVPATQDAVAGVQTVTGTYSVSVNLSRVTSPINMVTPLAGSYLYPLNYYTSVAVQFTSLNDSNPGSGSSPGSTSTSNGATAVTGLVANCPLQVGKISATLVGQVVDATTKLPVGAGFTVGVYPFGVNFSINSPAAAITTTDADGKFTISNLSAATTYTVGARNADQSISNIVGAGGGQLVATAGEGQSVFYTLASGIPITVAKQDVSVPQIVSLTPANYSTQPVGSIDVVYTFSSSITQNAYALAVAPTTPGAVAIYNDVAANFLGYKAGNVAFNLSWIDDKHLKVTIPTVGVSSIYSVSITNVLANAQFKSLGKSVAGMGKDTVTFYTAGGAVAVAPVVAVSNASTLDFSGPVNLTWNPAQGAKRYNVYRATRQVFANTSTAINNHSYVLISDPAKGEVRATTYSDTPLPTSFVENATGNHIKLTYRYIVSAVNSDGVETLSLPVAAADVVPPRLTGPYTNYAGQFASGASVITLTFHEPLDKVSAETKGNYSLSSLGGVTVTSATYNEAAWTVTLKLSAAIDPTKVDAAYIKTGAKGLGAYFYDPKDVQNFVSGNGLKNTAGVTAKAGNARVDAATVVAGDDQPNPLTATTLVVNTGADGICQTTAITANGDVQTIGVGLGQAGSTAVTASSTFLYLASSIIPAGDNFYVWFPAITITGVKDVAGNLIDPKANVVYTDGFVGGVIRSPIAKGY